MRPNSFYKGRQLLTCAISSCAFGLAQAAPTKKERSIRPVVPIRQNVTPTASGSQATQSVSIQIPSSVIPGGDASLFPNGSIPEVDSSVGSEVVTTAGRSGQDGPPDKKDGGKKSTDKSTKADGPRLSQLRHEAHILATKGLTYKFGAQELSQGGLDCSSTIQYLLNKIGVEGCPRTSYDQYAWLKRKKLLDDVYGKNAQKKIFEKLAPGDLIFWGGTWKSGHRVSHVMLYMGYNKDEDKHYVFGARGKKSTGLLGNGVDIFEMDLNRGRLIAHGKIPGLIYD